MMLALLLTAWVTGAVVFPLTFHLVQDGRSSRQEWISDFTLGLIWPLTLSIGFVARGRIRRL